MNHFPASCHDPSDGWDEGCVEVNETDVSLLHVEDGTDPFEFAMFIVLRDRKDWIDPGSGSVNYRVIVNCPSVFNPFLDVFGEHLLSDWGGLTVFPSNRWFRVWSVFEVRHGTWRRTEGGWTVGVGVRFACFAEELRIDSVAFVSLFD